MAFYNGFSTIGLENRWKLGDVELVKRDILNQFQTRLGERLHNPTFGSIVWDLQFEPMSDELREELIADANRIIASDPRVVSRGVTVQAYENGFQLEMDLYLVDVDVATDLYVQFNQQTLQMSNI